MKKFLRILSVTLLTLVIVTVIGFLVWTATPPKPESPALKSLQSTQTVDFVETNRWLVFTPTNVAPNTGLILYPGGRVDYRSYAAHAMAIAEEGFLVVLVPMPLNFAFLGVNRASGVIQSFPSIDIWAVGGHSLGGAMAAEFASDNPNLIEGLLLWASYPAQSTDLSTSQLNVLSIFASNDGLATREDIDDSITRLPGDAIFVEIEGGNHAGFGWYGAQNGDGLLTISQETQQQKIVENTAQWLESLQIESNVE